MINYLINTCDYIKISKKFNITILSFLLYVRIYTKFWVGSFLMLMTLDNIKEIMSLKGEYSYFTMDYNRFKADNSKNRNF